MYPLPVVLVGCTDSVRRNVRREVGAASACVQFEFRDVGSALHHFAQFGKDDLFLLLVYLRSVDDLKDLQRLGQALPGKPILALRDEKSDQTLFLGALRAGAAFAVPVPLDPQDFRTALDWIGKQFGFAPKRVPVIAVAGVSGGCGGTVLAINLAESLGTRHGKHVVLVELALRMGMMATYLQASPHYNIHHLIQEQDDLDVEFVRQALAKVNDRLHLLAGPQQAIQAHNVTPADIRRILRYTWSLADVIVLGVPCTYDDLYFETLGMADEIVLVWEQKIPSFRALQMVRDALHIKKIPVDRQTLVLNRYDPRVTGFSTVELQQLLAAGKLRTIANDSAVVMKSVKLGVTLRQQAPNSRALADIDALAQDLLRLPPAAGPGTDRANVFGRMIRAFGLTS